MQRIRANADKELSRATNYSIRMMDQTRKDASLRAEQAAILEINRILKNDEKVRALVENAIETRVFERLDTYTNTIEKELLDLMYLMPDFIVAVDRIRVGDKKAFLLMDSFRINSTDPFISELAELIILKKKEDYQASMDKNLERYNSNYYPFGEPFPFGNTMEMYILANYIPINRDFYYDTTKTNIQLQEVVIRTMFDIIEFDDDLNNIGWANRILKEQISTFNVDIFDFKKTATFKKDYFSTRNIENKEFEYLPSMFDFQGIYFNELPDYLLSDTIKTYIKTTTKQ